MIIFWQPPAPGGAGQTRSGGEREEMMVIFPWQIHGNGIFTYKHP